MQRSLPSSYTLSNRRTQSGYTLIELMISITLSMFIIIGVLALYANSREAFQSQERIGRLMENGRIAAELMNQSIRNARYWGCSGVDDDNVTINIKDDLLNIAKSVRGIYGTDGGLSTDSITVYKALDDTAKIIGIDPSVGGSTPGNIDQTSGVWVEEGAGFTTGDYIVVNNCEKANVFEVNVVTTNTGDPDHLSLVAWNCLPAVCSYAYGSNSQVLKVEHSTYSISANKELQVSTNNGSNNVLVANVEDMQILYGEDIDDDENVDQYILPGALDGTTANSVNAHCASDNNCWRSVASVRISLLLRTEDNVTQNTSTYYFNGATVTPTDHRLRREFMTIVSLRNHRT